MKKIQLITFNTNDFINYSEDIEISDFNNLKAIDNYEINIFDLSNSNIWRNKSRNSQTPEEITELTTDFRSINTMIKNSKKSKIIFCIPQNIRYYCKFYEHEYYYQLKDMIFTMTKILEQINPINGFQLIYENNITEIGEFIINSSFYFNNNQIFEPLTYSKDSEKITTIKKDNIIITSLELIKKGEKEKLIQFLSEINVMTNKTSYPDWLYQYEFNDDKMQIDNIDKAKKIIEEQKDIIKSANEKLKENLHYKSILVSNSDELVNVVFEILEYIFDISLKDFCDEKKEDFLFKKNEVTFIGEIKGVTSNVKYENISQLEVHYSKYLDKLQEEGIDESIKKILIMNYERNKDISKRDEINSMQIKLAKKNETLIIDTKNLLTLYEKVMKKELSKEDVIKYITNNSGLINVDKI